MKTTFKTAPMKHLAPLAMTAVGISMLAAFPASAQSNEELLKELRALRDRVNQLEQRLQQQAAPAPTPAPGQWGMTPEQARELNRVSVKAESLQDSLAEQGLKGLTISGQIDPTYIYNRAQDNGSFVLLNNGGARYTYDNSYFGMAVIDFAKETESGTRFKLTLAPERGTGALFNGGSIVHEASVSVPLGDLNTRLWVGQIPDWTGYEITLPAGNKLITHNLLFDTMAPTAYTGAVLDVTAGKWWLRGGVANVNTARNKAGNKGQAFIYRVDYSRGEFSGWGFSGLHGKATNFAADGTWMRDTGQVDADGNPVLEEVGFADAGKQSNIHLLEVDGYYVRGDLSLYGQVSYGQQAKSAIFNSDGKLRDARWWGVSATMGYMLTPRLEAVLRADYVNNERNGGGLLGYSVDDAINGIGRGQSADGQYAKGQDKGANRYALSLGMRYLFDENTSFKVEYRHDGADQPVFGYQKGQEGRGYKKSNQLFGASVVVSF